MRLHWPLYLLCFEQHARCMPPMRTTNEKSIACHLLLGAREGVIISTALSFRGTIRTKKKSELLRTPWEDYSAIVCCEGSTSGSADRHRSAGLAVVMTQAIRRLRCKTIEANETISTFCLSDEK